MMIELDINSDFEAKIYKYHRNRTLSDIIRSCENKLTNEIKYATDADSDDFNTIETLLRTFLCCYGSIEDQLEKRDIFSGESGLDQLGLIRTYSIYSASKAVLNRLNNDFIEKIRAQEFQPPNVSLTYSDINQTSEFAVLTTVFSQLKHYKGGTTSKSIRYSYFSFFNRLRDISRNYINSSCSHKTKKKLNSIRINKSGLDFSEISPPQRREFSNSNGNGYSSSVTVEKLPGVLPTYEPNPKAKIENIIGNINAKIVLHAATIRVLSYDKQLMKNPFCEEGRSFQDAFLVHGPPGVGKTYTIDAIANHLVQNYGNDVSLVDLSSGIKSMYVDRSAAIFERYIMLEKESNKSHINIIDEADGVFTSNEHGEMHEESKKLLREMKNAINKNTKGNAIYIFMTNYPSQFEAALKQRFEPLYMEGATTSQEFSDLLVQELGHSAKNLSKSNISNLGSQLNQYRMKLSPKPKIIENQSEKDTYITGRNVKQIAAPFVSGDDFLLVQNEEIIKKASYAQKMQLIPQLLPDASYESISAAIKGHMEEIQKSSHNYC